MEVTTPLPVTSFLARACLARLYTRTCAQRAQRGAQGGGAAQVDTAQHRAALPGAQRRGRRLTFWWVATKKKGLVGWKSTRTTRPRFLRNGFWVVPLLSWCTSTACVLPVGATLAK